MAKSENVRRLAALTMVPPLANEVVSQIEGATNTKTQIAALTALTDSSGGTAGATIVAVPATYTQATLANQLASLTAKVNAIIAALKA